MAMVVSPPPCRCPAQLLTQLLTMAISSAPPLPCPPHRNGVFIAGLRIVGGDGDLLRWTAQVWAICRTLSVGTRGSNDDHEQRPCALPCALHVILSCLRPAGQSNKTALMLCPISAASGSVHLLCRACPRLHCPQLPLLHLFRSAQPLPPSRPLPARMCLDPLPPSCTWPVVSCTGLPSFRVPVRISGPCGTGVGEQGLSDLQPAHARP